jgi:nicotinamide-nucleotide amidase
MNVELVRDQAIVDVIAGFFEARGRTMTDNNARQADVPGGRPSSPRWPAPRPASSARSATRSSTPCPASPTRWPRCSNAASCPTCAPAWPRPARRAVIASRVCAPGGPASPGWPSPCRTASTRWTPPVTVTLAFLASGIEGIKVRITARARTPEDVTALLDKEEAEVRRAIEDRLGDIVFGVDDESMEVAVAARLIARG